MKSFDSRRDDAGERGRKIAATFCYLHSSRCKTVSKSFVAKLVQAEAESILRLRRDLKNPTPCKMPRNLIWALDMTYLPKPPGGHRTLLGVIDHGSRTCLALHELKRRRTVDILRVVLHLPTFSVLPCTAMHPPPPDGASCPVENGRIEHLFPTLMERIESWRKRLDETPHVDQAELDLHRLHRRLHRHRCLRLIYAYWSATSAVDRTLEQADSARGR